MVKHCVIVVMVLIYLQQLLQHVYFLDFTAVKALFVYRSSLNRSTTMALKHWIKLAIEDVVM